MPPWMLAVVILAIVVIGYYERTHNRAKVADGRPEAMDALFDGSAQVTYTGRLATAALVSAATSRGYRLVSEAGSGASRSVVFERAMLP